jgi:hypothetical protein
MFICSDDTLVTPPGGTYPAGGSLPAGVVASIASYSTAYSAASTVASTFHPS